MPTRRDNRQASQFRRRWTPTSFLLSLPTTTLNRLNTWPHQFRPKSTSPSFHSISRGPLPSAPTTQPDNTHKFAPTWTKTSIYPKSTKPPCSKRKWSTAILSLKMPLRESRKTSTTGRTKGKAQWEIPKPNSRSKTCNQLSTTFTTCSRTCWRQTWGLTRLLSRVSHNFKLCPSTLSAEGTRMSQEMLPNQLANLKLNFSSLQLQE